MINTIRNLLILLAFLAHSKASGQDRNRASSVIEDLCSDEMAGRGYINNGAQKAANYISKQYTSLGLKSFGDSYEQPFYLNVNTINKSKVALDDSVLIPGVDYLVSTTSGDVSGKFKLFYVSPKMLKSSKIHKKLRKAYKKGYLPVIPAISKGNPYLAKVIDDIIVTYADRPLILLKTSLTWSVGRSQEKGTQLWLLESSFDPYAKCITIEVEAELMRDYKTQNVIGYVEGTMYPDSVVIICGHYDHLGKMGEAIFYGANDNASGIALMLDMASFFAENPQKYTIAFIAFGAEEAGLVGSQYYVQHPLFPLQKTKFVVNMDLMGSGDGGATIVNATVFPAEFAVLKKINDEKQYLPKIKARGKAANSDHYFFTEAGVPAFFIYLMGEYTHYHIPADNADNLKLGPYYEKSFSLVRDFIVYLSY
jgi:hypothetical protein